MNLTYEQHLHKFFSLRDKSLISKTEKALSEAKDFDSQLALSYLRSPVVFTQGFFKKQFLKWVAGTTMTYDEAFEVLKKHHFFGIPYPFPLFPKMLPITAAVKEALYGTH